jgi:hypothetical protein
MEIQLDAQSREGLRRLVSVVELEKSDAMSLSTVLLARTAG